MKIKSFTDLEVYKEARKFRKMISAIIKEHFPDKEKYLLTAQTLDASRSVTANIAEGHGRHYFQENIRFCRISKGSLEETLEHLITVYDEKYISVETLKEVKSQHEICLKLLNGYIRYLKKTKKGEFD